MYHKRRLDVCFYLGKSEFGVQRRLILYFCPRRNQAPRYIWGFPPSSWGGNSHKCDCSLRNFRELSIDRQCVSFWGGVPLGSRLWRDMEEFRLYTVLCVSSCQFIVMLCKCLHMIAQITNYLVTCPDY